MLCERCGNEITDNTTICPQCGTQNRRARASAQPPTSYGHFPESGFGTMAPDQQNYPPYSPQAGIPPVPQKISYIPGSLPNPLSYSTIPQYPPGVMVQSTMTHLTATTQNTSGLTIEIIFSLIGIFGLGWLMAGEVAAGVILLVCSVLIYWPIIILGTVFTDGFGLICLGPLAIGSIILNAVLLNGVLKRKATRFIVMQSHQPPHLPIPPQPQ